MGFDGAAPIGKFISLYPIASKQEEHADELGMNTHFKPLPDDLSFTIKRNNDIVFEGCSKDQLNHIDKIIAQISQHYTLRQGDCIFTGCPSQAVEVKINDHIEGFLNQQNVLRFNIK